MERSKGGATQSSRKDGPTKIDLQKKPLILNQGCRRLFPKSSFVGGWLWRAVSYISPWEMERS